MPELRKDPVVERWCIIATDRARRPKDFKNYKGAGTEHFTDEGRDNCPFCYGREGRTPPEIIAYGRPAEAGPDTPGWKVRVVPNMYPALEIEGEPQRVRDGMYERMNGIGAHEVIIETPDHERTVDEMTVGDISGMVRAFRDRMVDLRGDRRFKYVQVFKNFGLAAGASLEHPHCQLIATPVIPGRIVEELEGALAYYKSEERCIFCDIVRRETRDRERIIFEDDYFVSMVPFAPRFPFEVHIIPRRHEAAFTDIDELEVRYLSVHFKMIIGKIKLGLGNPPYNFMFHTAPGGQEGIEHYHWHVELIPKLAKVAGFEWGTGLYINPTLPEQTAEDLRDIRFNINDSEPEVGAK